MAKNATPNIDYMLQMAKDYIDGIGNPLDFELDYGYEFEKRYRKMEKENRELTEVIFDYLVQEGSDHAVDESGEKLRKRIKKQYECVMEAREEIW